jgi:hypothetical protein
MPPITDPTAIPALAPVLREAVGELVESPSSEIASRSVDEADVEADVEVEVPSSELIPRSVEEAAIEVEVSSVVMVVKRVAVVEVEDSSSDEQLPNRLWHLFRSRCQRQLAEFRKTMEAIEKKGDTGPYSPVTTIRRILATVPFRRAAVSKCAPLTCNITRGSHTA